MHSELDAFDRKILALLQEDASLSSAQIAEQGACRNRRAGGGFSG